MKAGAASVTVADIDDFACAVATLNAARNDVQMSVIQADLLAASGAHHWDVILAGDIFYERDTAQHAHTFLAKHAARGALVLIGDPGRSYLPRDKLRRIVDYSVPVTRDLEDAEIKLTAVWELLARPDSTP
jgi:predicted nicotinamide N-methyase